jgi:hypothetical protein
MPKQSSPDDEKPGTLGAPNQASAKEPAEGSPENVNTGSPSGGISNRPQDREQQEQDQLPPRGGAKGGAHA